MCVSAHTHCESGKNEGSRLELHFDVACRTSRTPDFLACTYKVLAGSVALAKSMNCAFVPADGPGIVVIPKGCEVQVNRKLDAHPVLCCKATDIRFQELPATIRWHFSIQRSSGGPIQLATKRVR
jgi:hypothetical protein